MDMKKLDFPRKPINLDFTLKDKDLDFTTKQVHISQITAGDTILHNLDVKTVTNSNIKNCPFMGKSLFGDSYNLGYKLVTLIIYKK